MPINSRDQEYNRRKKNSEADAEAPSYHHVKEMEYNKEVQSKTIVDKFKSLIRGEDPYTGKKRK